MYPGSPSSSSPQNSCPRSPISPPQELASVSVPPSQSPPRGSRHVPAGKPFTSCFVPRVSSSGVTSAPRREEHMSPGRDTVRAPVAFPGRLSSYAHAVRPLYRLLKGRKTKSAKEGKRGEGTPEAGNRVVQRSECHEVSVEEAILYCRRSMGM
ncbi:hypothetical protein MLD38_009001 [Melastoma candidum]|uniref:Uncharacterized protein n=1 Tax=Melastoma candidum TaxID=119954 RepID=A0ACB9RW42_9MYRT|nr:hypothetical protein MLD38_009001 [Melastoma candidum]